MPGRWWRRAVACAACLVIVALPLALNALKFDHPLDTGYLRLYEERDDELARDAKTHGLFSPHFITIFG